LANEGKSDKAIQSVIMAPVLYGIGGSIFGTAVMCLVAPRAFLTGPVGRPWMKWICTESVTVARVACLLFGLLVSVPLVAIGVLIAMGR
jgi:hypothetical protein